jgi:hypothetical protein
MRFLKPPGRWILDFAGELAALGSFIKLGDCVAGHIMSTGDDNCFQPTALPVAPTRRWR